jgi:hypothetical protein
MHGYGAYAAEVTSLGLGLVELVITIYGSGWSNGRNGMLINHMLLALGVHKDYEAVETTNLSAHLESVCHKNGYGHSFLTGAI